METKKISATDLARSLADILNRVRYQRERFVVVRSGEPVAVITPPWPVSGTRFSELTNVWRRIPLPDEDFGADLESVQAMQPSALSEVPDWPS